MVLVSGLAGALAPECRTGDLVLYRQCHFIEGKDMIAGTTGCDGNFTDQLRDRLNSFGLRVHEGDALTLPRLICNASEKREAGLRHRAIAVDMESYQILDVAEKSGYPKAVLRVISDDLQHDLPDINAGLDPKARVKNLRMLASLGAHPLLAARFLFNIRHALEQLKPALRSVLGAAYASKYINHKVTNT
jgi:nucleoside phosphorylase